MKNRLVVFLFAGVLCLTACDSGGGSSNSESSKATSIISYTRATLPTLEPTTEEPTLIPLSIPNNIVITQDGDSVLFDWPDVETATGYECTYEGAKENFITDKSHFTLKNNLEGKTFKVKVRAIRETSKGTEYSGWGNTTVTVATNDYEKIGYGTAMFLSAKQVAKWAATKGYECETTTKNDVTTVSVHTKDTLNSGFFNSAGRILSSAIAGFLGGYEETLQDDFSSVDKIIDKYVDSGSIKNLINEEDEAATQNGKLGALKGALNAALLDTDIYFVYYFSDTAKSSTMATFYLLENKREDYVKSTFGSYKKDNQGRYIIPYEYFNGNAYFEATEITSNGFKKWAIVGTHD